MEDVLVPLLQDLFRPTENTELGSKFRQFRLLRLVDGTLSTEFVHVLLEVLSANQCLIPQRSHLGVLILFKLHIPLLRLLHLHPPYKARLNEREGNASNGEGERP